MKKQLLKEDFVEIAKEFGYNVKIDGSNYKAIYLNNEISGEKLIAWLDVEAKKGGCYDVRLAFNGDICTKEHGRTLVSKEALKNHLKRIEKDTLFWKKQYKLKLIKLIGINE